jgi:hypothetical protein
MSFGGPVAINNDAVFKIMGEMGIRDRLDCLRKIKLMFYLLNKDRESTKEKE